MKKGVGLIIVAIFTALLLIFFTNPEFLDKAWLWMVGFAGYILVLLENTYKSLTKAFEGKGKTDQPEVSPPGHDELRSQVEEIEGRVLQIEKNLENAKNADKANRNPIS